MKHLLLSLTFTSAFLLLVSCQTQSTEPESHSGNIATQQAKNLATSGPGSAMPSPTP